MNDIDLPPHEWTSDRPKPREPIFGAGWPIGLATIIGLFVAAYFADQSGKVPLWAGIAASVGAFIVFQISEAIKR